MRPIEDQTILITGSTDGLGKKVAIDLAKKGATVLLHGRSPEKGEAVRREIQAAAGNPRVRYYNADFASLDAVRGAADEIEGNHDRIDVLINNAGIGARSLLARRELSIDGYELRFAVNYLSHFILTRRLLPLIRKSAPARIINVTSIGQQPIDLGDLMLHKSYDDLRAYRQSKLAQIMFTIDLAGELGASGVTVNCVHPAALMNTNMVTRSAYFNGPLSTVEEGAEAVEYIVTAPELDNVTGEFFVGKSRSQANAQAYDPAARGRLRELSGQLADLSEEALRSIAS